MTAVAVSMFFNLRDLPDSNTNVRPVEFYVKNGEVTLGVQAPLVLLCDETTRPWLEEARTRLAPTMETIYVEKPLTEYDLYSTTHSIITQNRITRPTRDSRNTASYCILMILKFLAIKIAAEKMPTASHYVWVDIGCDHVLDKFQTSLPLILSSPNPKVSCTYIHYRSHTELESISGAFAHGGYCGIAGGIISVEAKYVNLFLTRCLTIFYEMLANGVGYSDEVVLTYAFDRYPDMFHLTYGDYYSIATNYKFVTRDYPAIRNYFINTTLAAGRKDLACVCAQKVLESIDQGCLTLEESEIAFLKGITTI
jgi:hypothetical protein